MSLESYLYKLTHGFYYYKGKRRKDRRRVNLGHHPERRTQPEKQANSYSTQLLVQK